MPDKIIGLIDEEATPPIVFGVYRASTKANAALNLKYGSLDEFLLLRFLRMIALDAHDTDRLEQAELLILEGRPFTALMDLLDVEKGLNVDEALWDELDDHYSDLLDADVVSKGINATAVAARLKAKGIEPKHPKKKVAKKAARSRRSTS